MVQVRGGAVGAPLLAPYLALRFPDHSAPALRPPATYAVRLTRARLAATNSSNGTQVTLRSLVLARAPVRAHTPWLSRHFVNGAATAGANVLLARSTALRRSACGAGCGLHTKTAPTPPPLPL